MRSFPRQTQVACSRKDKSRAMRLHLGFTLVEMAVVMVIMGLVMLTLLPALNTVRSANQVSLTQSNLRSLMLATAAYVQANGCLPCPAIPGGTGTDFGKVGYYKGSTSSDPKTATACGNCTAPQGIAPFVSLGVPASIARDGWGHWITMRVDPALTSGFGVVPPTAGCQCSDFASNALPAGCTAGQSTLATATPSCTVLNASQKGLCRTGLSLSTTGPITVTIPGNATQQVAVIFVSHGSDGYGSYVVQPPGYLIPFASNYAQCSPSGYVGYAQCNGANNTSGSKSAQFYDAQATVGTTDTYNDVLAYADRNTLVSMLGNPGCNTVW